MNQKNIQSAQFGKQLMKRRLKWTGWVSLVPIAVVVFALCYFGYHEAIAFGELKHKLLEYRQAGEPVDDESMAKFFEGMSNKEGTEAWSEILELNQAIQNAYNESIKLPIVGLGKLPVQLLPGSDWSDEASVAEYLQEVQPIIARIERASSFPRPVWMPIHFEGFSTLLPQLQESRSIARILELDAMHALYHKDTGRAARDIGLMRSVAETFDWGFCAVTNLVHIAIVSMQYDAIQKSLAMNVWSEEQLNTLSEQVANRYEVSKAWNASYAGERGMAYSVLDKPDSIMKLSDNDPLARQPILPSSRLAMLTLYEQCQHCMDSGEAKLAEKAVRTEQTFRTLSMTNWHIALFMPAIALHADAFDRFETRRRLTYTSIAVKRFQLKNHRWPKNLSELTEVGLTANDWTTPGNLTFGYQADAEAAYVWSCNHSDKQTIPKSRPNLDQPEDSNSFPIVTISAATQ